MRITRVLVTLSLVGTIGASPGAAQDRPAGQPWPPELRAGRSIWVAVGQDAEVEIHGEVVDVSGSLLRLRQNGDLRTFTVEEVRRIEVRDSLRNGTLVGAAVGAAALGVTYAVLAATICPDCGEEEVANSLEWAALGAGLGAIAGLSLDALHKGRRAIYVAPVVSRSRSHSGRRFGATVILAW